MDAAYYRHWRAAHPEYRQRQQRQRRDRRRLLGRGDRSGEYTRRREMRALRADHDAQAAYLALRHPIMDEAMTLASRMVHRDERATVFDPKWEECVMVAALAICEGTPPRDAIRLYLRAEARYRAVHLPLQR